MLQAIFLAFQMFPGNDPVRAAELQQRAMIERAREHERAARQGVDAQQRQFEIRFNRLVDAVKNFSARYNAGKGHAWPAREAAKLRDAMRELQQLEDSLRPDRRASSEPHQCSATIRE
jgi:hypothetical protein